MTIDPRLSYLEQALARLETRVAELERRVVEPAEPRCERCRAGGNPHVPSAGQCEACCRELCAAHMAEPGICPSRSDGGHKARR